MIQVMRLKPWNILMQIIGPQYGDRTCIDFARLLESEFHGFVPPEGYA